MMKTTTKTGNKAANGQGALTSADVTRLFDEGYHGVEVLPDGRIREAPSFKNGASDEIVTKTLKTQRTWY